jgi:hypothetical protein
MRLLIAGFALALMTATAHAQVPQMNTMSANQRVGDHASKNLHAGDDKDQKPKANEKAYNAALRNLPDKQYDPWHGVR